MKKRGRKRRKGRNQAPSTQKGRLRGLRIDLMANGQESYETPMAGWRQQVAKALSAVEGLDLPVEALHQLCQLVRRNRGSKGGVKRIMAEAAEERCRKFAAHVGLPPPKTQALGEPDDLMELVVRNLYSIDEVQFENAVTIAAPESGCAFTVFLGGLAGEGGWSYTVRGMLSFVRGSEKAARAILSVLNALSTPANPVHLICRYSGVEWRRMPSLPRTPETVLNEFL